MTQEPFEKRVALGGKGGASAPPMRSQRLAALAAEATCSPLLLARASGAEAPPFPYDRTENLTHLHQVSNLKTDRAIRGREP